MRVLALIFAAALLGWLEHGAIALLRAPPDLSLALAAVLLLRMSGGQGLVAVWVLGLFCDLTDPASQWFHAVAFVFVSVLGLPLLERLRGWHAVGWFVLAASMSLAVQAIDVWVSGVGEAGLFTVLARAFGTGVLALPLGWLALSFVPALRVTPEVEKRDKSGKAAETVEIAET